MFTNLRLKVPVKGSSQWVEFEAMLTAKLGRKLTREEVKYLVKIANHSNRGKVRSVNVASKAGQAKNCREINKFGKRSNVQGFYKAKNKQLK